MGNYESINKHINPALKNFYCIKCNTFHDLNLKTYFCPKCGFPLIHYYDTAFLLKRKSQLLNSKSYGLSKFNAFLPIDSKVINKLTLGEGNTPLIHCKNLGSYLGLKNLFIKYEGMNPTGTFIDRGSILGISIPYILNDKKVIIAGLGDLAVSATTYAIRAGLKPITVIPRDVDINKLNQIKVLGGFIKLVNDYEEAIKKGLNLSSKLNYFVILNTSPFVLDGFKTEGYEIAEQMSWKAPNKIFVPVGDGANLVMIYKGLTEFYEAGLIKSVNTEMIAVQHISKPSIKNINKDVRVVEKVSTVNKYMREILIKKPLMLDGVIKVLEKSRGATTIVDDNDLFEAMKLLAKYEGLIVDPLGATGLAGLIKMLREKSLDKDEEVVVLVTASPVKHPLFLSDLVNVFKKFEEELPLISEVKLMILEVIMSKGETHAYEVWRTLKNVMNYDIKPATVYQHIKELNEMGLIEKSKVDLGGGNIKIKYKLTKKGLAILKSIYG